MSQPIPFGNYLLLERVSVGGMAEVFKAKAFGVEGFEKLVAIKRILPAMAEDEEFVRMFIDEAKIAGQLTHPNIGQIYELGTLGDAHFIALELVWGKDLLEVLSRARKLQRPLLPAQCAYVASKLCEALDYAHRKKDQLGRPLGIIHRDVSPQNVLVSYEGEVKLIDFGIAKAASRSAQTQAGVLKGKFGYMSPEQALGQPLDRRSDVFSIGTILWEMLACERLFRAESDLATLERVRNAEVPPIHTRRVPPALEKIARRALAREPDARYQWASEMQEELQAFLLSQEPLAGAKSLASWLKDAFAAEIAREQIAHEAFRKIGKDALLQAEPITVKAPAPSAAPAPAARRSTSPPVEPAPPVTVSGVIEAQAAPVPREVPDGAATIIEDAETPVARFARGQPVPLHEPSRDSVLDGLPTALYAEPAAAPESKPREEQGSSPGPRPAGRISTPPPSAARPPGQRPAKPQNQRTPPLTPTPLVEPARGVTETAGLGKELAIGVGVAVAVAGLVALLRLALHPVAPPAASVAIGAPMVAGPPPAPARRTGALELTVPPGALIEVDGNPGALAGEPPRLTLAAGLSHVVRIWKPHRAASIFAVGVSEGQVLARTLSLDRPGASLSVVSAPPGADVLLDEAPVGVTPLSLDTVDPARPHRVTVQLAGFLPETRSLVYAAQEQGPVVLDVALRPSGGEPAATSPQPPVIGDGYLLVSSDPPGAEVWVDGGDAGRRTPMESDGRIRLAAGEHTIGLALGGRRWDYRITMEAGKNSTLMVQLR